MRNQALKDAVSDAEKLTELTVARIENQLKTVENIPKSLASVIENRDTIMFVGTRKVIENVLQRNPLIYGASVSFAPRINGSDTFYYAPYLHTSSDTIIFKDLGSVKYRYNTKAWYTVARDKGKGVWSEPYYDDGGGEAIMATYAVPFYRDHGTGRVFAGVVTADISLTGLQKVIQDIQFFDSGVGFLISSKANILTFPGLDSLKDNLIHNLLEEDITPAMMQVIVKMTNGERDVLAMRGLGRTVNRNYWISYAPVPTANWSLGIRFHESELYEGIHQLYIRLIAIGLLGFFLLAVMIFYIAGRFVKPIEKLAHATKKIGSGDFNYNLPSFNTDDEIAELGRSFSQMQVELQVYIKNLKETTAQKEKMESELDIANNIQQQMLPKVDEIPGREGIRHYGMLKPARQVGGDLYDFMIQDKFLYFAIGDVSGKGIPAALFMAKALTLFRAKVALDKDPEGIAAEINNDLEMYNAESMFVTFFIGKLDLNNGEMIYANSGHNSPYTINEGVRILKGNHGLPLGSISDQVYGQDRHQFSKGEKIILFTDGISEATNRSNKLYGEDRLTKLLEEMKDSSPREIGDAIMDSVQTFAEGAEQSDDITLFILEYN